MTGQLRITGQLMEHACVRYSGGPEHRAVLVLSLATAAGISWAVRQDCGATPAEQMAAERKAAQLRAGSRCEVYAAGARMGTHFRGDPALYALDVTNVIPLGILPVTTPGD
jgi:hypothetical protein